ncbi:alkylation response protein AidB-like acyl-CoA dehydrogenase/DNA-binding IclR family transcriptional regulator [Paraburkholderia bryophila]|uniref:Alkylation response protein AidB-like acyl-CoA dehydrogenase/DNA-binding IclR family transcriptional regulator n=2 Tax=Paraburkholderia bryophila TaxID=420952 RepID=A0A7Z0B255_9BURK|nr:alkylation response protein AidB-like acyl-CoA dehydrogenase/DNA-binding IclR family transcriptional regulator [Paraburkholderia bryophila]
MNFDLTEDQLSIQAAIEKLCEKYDDEYWLSRDRDGGFPHDFHRTLADAGWLGIAMSPDYGGSGLGMTEAALMMRTISGSGAGLSGASAVHMNIFGLNPVQVFGNDAQKRRFLPPLIDGRDKACFAVTEPDAGLDTTHLKTQAVRDGDHYVLTGRKIWISTAQVASKMLIIARTTPFEQCAKPTDGLTLFYTDLDRERVEVREIEKMGRKAVDSNMLFIDNLRVPVEDRIGDEGAGFRYLLHGLNPERILIAAEAIGLGQAALKRATQYAKERVVFGRPIGQNQGIQHPLAQAWMQLEAANLMVFKAAALYDAGQPCGAEANAAKYLAAEAAFQSCQTAIATLGGMGYAKEYHVERYLRECMIPRLAPVSPQMILCFIAEKVLGPAEVVLKSLRTAMDVKLVARTLDLFELFAAEQRPLPLTELARLLNVPMSSCLALARTLVSRGYLYEVRKRGGYYPTRRLQMLASAINAVDPIVEMVHPRLVQLRDASGETAVLGKIQGAAVVYLDVVESTKAIRYTRAPGELRPLHANSIGKAIFGELNAAAQQALGTQLSFDHFTAATVVDLPALVAQAAAAKAQGWCANLGESAPELSAVAVAVTIGGDLYGLSVVGPTERIQKDQNAHATELMRVKQAIEAQESEQQEPQA